MQSLTALFSDYRAVEPHGPAGRRALDVTLGRSLTETLKEGSKFPRVDLMPGEICVHLDDEGRHVRLRQSGWRHARSVPASKAILEGPAGEVCTFEHPFFKVHGRCERRGDYLLAKDVEVRQTIRPGEKKKRKRDEEDSAWRVEKDRRLPYVLIHVPSGYALLPTSADAEREDLLEPDVDKWCVVRGVRMA